MKKLFFMFLAILSVTALTACSNGFDGSTVISTIDGYTSTSVDLDLIDSGYYRNYYTTSTDIVDGVTTYTSYGTFYNEYDYENEAKLTYRLTKGAFLTNDNNGICEITNVSSEYSYETTEKKYDYYTFDFSYTDRTYNHDTLEYDYTNYTEFNKVFYSYYNTLTILEEDKDDFKTEEDIFALIKKIKGCEVVSVSRFSLNSGIVLNTSIDDIEFFNEVSLKFI